MRSCAVLICLLSTATTGCTGSQPDNRQSEAAPPPAALAPATPAAPPAASTDTEDGSRLAMFVGDVGRGKAVFAQCAACHSDDAGVNGIGPSLNGVVGRMASEVADYTYSPANRDSGIIWTPEKLFQYLEAPQRVVPGTKMSYAGLADPAKRADVIAYLATL